MQSSDKADCLFWACPPTAGIYAAGVIDPYTDKNINKMNRVQRRAARFVSNNYNWRESVSDMLDTLDWDTLEQRRETTRLILFKQMLEGDIAIPSSQVQPHPRRGGRSAHNLSFAKPITTKNIYKFSFIPKTIQDWNDLPESIVLIESKDSFKTKSKQQLV
jgi:hypothetical protein